MEVACPVCQKKYTKLSIKAHVEICLQKEDKHTADATSRKKPSGTKSNSVLDKATVINPSSFNKYVEILSQSPARVTSTTLDIRRSFETGRKETVEDTNEPISLRYDEKEASSIDLSSLDYLSSFIQDSIDTNNANRESKRRAMRPSGNYLTNEQIFNEILDKDIRRLCEFIIPEGELNPNMWHQRHFFLGKDFSRKGTDCYNKFWKGDETTVNALYKQLLRDKIEHMDDGRVETIDSLPLITDKSFIDGIAEFVCKSQAGHNIKKARVHLSNEDFMVDEPATSILKDVVLFEKDSAVVRPTVSDVSDSMPIDSIKKDGRVHISYINQSKPNCAPNATHRVAAEEVKSHKITQMDAPKPNLSMGRVIRPEGCTMRSGINIDESAVLQRLPFNTYIRYDQVILLPPPFDDCIAVKRIHVTGIFGGFASVESKACINVVDYIGLGNDNFTLCDGWVSLTGRTLEDSAPIIEILDDDIIRL